ncbi:uncharacterized protein LOC123196509 isoform X2 [Mangifera indica]|uniref:uncharacterized protein LOC123196509 isoform X2 n=1 Tax=Mangifera indica TaxID=29780 RepID=UPI001CFB601F|nr:uncharacterized protein LOC123196509 isoform X2 [Mangifera indica]
MKKYGVRGPLLNAGICHLCRGDVFAIMEVARHKYIDPGVAIIEPLLNPTLLSHQSLTLAPFFFSSFFVNSSSSDDFAAFLEAELEATSAESSLDEDAEDDNYKMRKQGMKNLRMRKPEMKKPRMRRLQMIMASIARVYVWEECRAQVHRYPDAAYCAFELENDARAALITFCEES